MGPVRNHAMLMLGYPNPTAQQPIYPTKHVAVLITFFHQSKKRSFFLVERKAKSYFINSFTTNSSVLTWGCCTTTSPRTQSWSIWKGHLLKAKARDERGCAVLWEISCLFASYCAKTKLLRTQSLINPNYITIDSRYCTVSMTLRPH